VNNLFVRKFGKSQYFSNSIRLLCLTMVVFLLACQPAQTTRKTVDNRKVHDGVLGVKVAAVDRKDRCKGRVKVNRKRYGRLSSRSRRRQLYDYVTGIRRNVNSNWLKPKGVSERESCSVLIRQRIDGCVTKVSFKNCRHFKMRTTVRRAVLKASPLPQAPHPSLFSTEVLLNFKIK